MSGFAPDVALSTIAGHPTTSRASSTEADPRTDPVEAPRGAPPLPERTLAVRKTTPASRMAPSLGRPQRSSPPGGPPGSRYGTTSPRLRAAGLLAGVAAAVGLVAPGVAGAAVTAPRDVISFPARDFVSASGYDVNQPVTVEVVHPSGVVAGTVTDVTPKEDPATPGLGLVEVNHPGGACWVGVTPDIRAGDVVRDHQPGDRRGRHEHRAQRHRAAAGPDRRPTPCRSTARRRTRRQPAAGRRARAAARRARRRVHRERRAGRSARPARPAPTARCPTTPPAPTHWTATYTNLVPGDVTRALGAESRGMWIDPALPSTESTIFENGAAAVAGPAAPCTAPLEKLPPPPGSETVPPSDPHEPRGRREPEHRHAELDRVDRQRRRHRLRRLPRRRRHRAPCRTPTAPPGAPTTFTDLNVAAGSYTYTVDAGDAVGNRSGMSNQVSATTAVSPRARRRPPRPPRRTA